MSSINTNIGALVANTNLAKSQTSLNTSLQRLSSGLRINSGADDPSGHHRFSESLKATRSPASPPPSTTPPAPPTSSPPPMALSPRSPTSWSPSRGSSCRPPTPAACPPMKSRPTRSRLIPPSPPSPVSPTPPVSAASPSSTVPSVTSPAA